VSENSRNSFIVSDDHFSEDENVDPEKKYCKLKIVLDYADRWPFNASSNSMNPSPPNINIAGLAMVQVDLKTKCPL
jgi:hypothetical protein